MIQLKKSYSQLACVINDHKNWEVTVEIRHIQQTMKTIEKEKSFVFSGRYISVYGVVKAEYSKMHTKKLLPILLM